jgi:hypothetical protein
MKKLGIVLALVAMVAPGVSRAETAYFPHYLVNPISTQADGSTVGVYSAIHVSNVSGTAQTVTVVLHQMSGAPLAYYPVSVYVASMTPYAATTDANGAVQVTLPALGALSVELQPAGYAAAGWGTITGTTGYKLIADVTEYGRLPAVAYPGTSYSVSYAVNGGNPF